MADALDLKFNSTKKSGGSSPPVGNNYFYKIIKKVEIAQWQSVALKTQRSRVQFSFSTLLDFSNNFSLKKESVKKKWHFAIFILDSLVSETR